jgi:hypothetical protein
MPMVQINDEIAHDAQREWYRPTLVTHAIEETTLGKVGSQFDGPAMPAVFDGE